MLSHVEKNVFESTIGILLDIPGKSKDALKVRRDLQSLGIRPELHPQERDNEKFFLPAASYNLTIEEKNQSAGVCEESEFQQDSQQT